MLGPRLALSAAGLLFKIDVFSFTPVISNSSVSPVLLPKSSQRFCAHHSLSQICASSSDLALEANVTLFLTTFFLRDPPWLPYSPLAL